MIFRFTALCLSGTLLYAVLRYHVFGTSDWSQLPLWTANKAVSFSSAILLACSYLTRDRSRAKRLGLGGFALALLHGFMSMPLLSPAYYAKLYDGPRLSWTGELCMLGGCIAIVLLLAPAITSVPAIQSGMSRTDWLRWQRVGYLALAFTVLHVMALGTNAWRQPETWPGWMPPITLLSSIVLIVPVVLRLSRGNASLSVAPGKEESLPRTRYASGRYTENAAP